MRIQKLFEKLAVPASYQAAFPAFLGAAVFLLCVLFTFNSGDVKGIGFNYDNLSGGSFLLAGIYNPAVTWKMPFFDTVAALSLNLGVTPRVFFIAVYSGICALVFCAGCLLRGYRAGLLSLAAAGLFGARRNILNHDIEQAFYCFLLLLLLCLLLLRRREKTAGSSLLAGLAAGMTMLVRSPLLLFPPVLVLCEWLFYGERSRAFLLRSLVFLAASYVLLLPWGALNYAVSGRFSLADTRNAADNVITGAKGSVYTMEGDSRKLAGIGVDESALLFFLREAAGNPGTYALGVARRLWHIFLFYPLIFGAFIAAFAAGGGERRFGFLLPVYFILLHSLFSIEKRYFYPMAFVALPLVVSVLFPRRYDRPAAHPCGLSGKTVAALFWLSFCAALAVEGLFLAYPRRSAANRDAYGDFPLALKRFPNDRAIREAGCREFLKSGDYAGFYECLGAYSKRFDDRVKGYFLEARVSTRPAALALPRKHEMKCLIIRMLRELELGDRAAAMASFVGAYAEYEGKSNTLGGEPYKRDREIQQFIRRDSNNFWDRYVYDALLLWPPGGIARILSALGKNSGLTPQLRLLEYAAGNRRARGGIVERLARENIYSELAWDLSGGAQGWELLQGKAGEARPATQAYLRVLSAPGGAVKGSPLLSSYSGEAGIFELLALRDAVSGREKQAKACLPGAAGHRPLSRALCAFFSIQNASAAALSENFNALELELERDPVTLRFLSGQEASAGNLARARRLDSLAKKLSPRAKRDDKEKEGRSRELADSAVEKMRAGVYAPAERLLAEALAQNPQNPEALMTLCSLFVMQQKKEKALEACRNVSDVIYSNPAIRTLAFEMLASEASFERYKLLKELGRTSEARAALRQAVEKAPAAWPGLAEARKELKGF